MEQKSLIYTIDKKQLNAISMKNHQVSPMEILGMSHYIFHCKL